MPRGAKTARSVNKQSSKRELVFKEDQQTYGTVVKVLGNARMRVRFEAGTTAPVPEATCTVRGKMRKREWVNLHDVVLVALREFGDQHDIVHRYTPDEVAYMTRIGEFSMVSDDVDAEEPEHEIVFEDI